MRIASVCASSVPAMLPRVSCRVFAALGEIDECCQRLLMS